MFADDNFCNQLDALGGYQLYGLQLFSPMAFAGFKRVVDDPGHKGDDVDPNPLQRARAKAYMELLGKQNALGNWMPKPADQLRQQQLAIIKGALKDHRRVTFLLRADDGKIPIPSATGLTINPIATWTTTPPVVVTPRWLGVRKAPLAITRPPIAWVLYEIVATPAAPPVKPAPAMTKLD